MKVNLNYMLSPEQRHAGYQLVTETGTGIDIIRPTGEILKSIEDVRYAEIQSIRAVVQEDLEMSRSGVEFEKEKS